MTHDDELRDHPTGFTSQAELDEFNAAVNMEPMTPEDATEGANRFADADTVEALIHQAIGAGSSCWENLRGAGVFRSEDALQIGVEVIERLAQLNTPSVHNPQHLRFAASVVEQLGSSHVFPLPPGRLRALADALDAGRRLPETLTKVQRETPDVR